MLINNVYIENFRCYYGKNDISFNKNGKITLIYGDSGRGKSSFLQFFRWMFYSEYDFGKTDDKAIFNEVAYREKKPGEKLRVSGRIDFEHLGVQYSLVKSFMVTVSFNIKAARIDAQETNLSILNNNNWEPFGGDISNKINSILPKALSKYFFLDGEKARDIVLNSSELKKAISAMFGLNVYEEALSHIGHKNKGNSVLGYYNREMTGKLKPQGNLLNNMTPAEFQEAIQELYESIEDLKAQRHEIMDQIEAKNTRKEEIFKIIGEANSQNNIKRLIKLDEDAIKRNEALIKNKQKEIGNLFYKTYPYLFLAKLASASSTTLREKNLSFARSYHNIFENLKKDLLKEIIEKGTCVCGRELDSHAEEHINGIMSVMPPDSYTYQFGQFVSKSKSKIQWAEHEIMNYDLILNEIAKLEKENKAYSDDIRDKMDDLKRLEGAAALVEELEQIKEDVEQLGKVKAGLEGKIAQKKQLYEISNKQLESVLKNNQVSTKYTEIINFFEQLKQLIAIEKNNREQQVKTVLNDCVRSVFKKLTTQTELDADKLQFIKDDFSLRTTYLSGGQLAVDEYSYVIGIVKALKECDVDNDENPIIIDAPFAFTGDEQSEHIFRTLPTISNQTVLLTLDLHKIRDALGDTKLYDFYVIKNDSQEKATIERGDINEIDF